jgi:uncharacterized protein YqeY
MPAALSDEEVQAAVALLLPRLALQVRRICVKSLNCENPSGRPADMGKVSGLVKAALSVIL